MSLIMIRISNIVFAGLIAGTLFGIWIGYNPQNLSSQAYIESQQSVIKSLNTLMPLLGLIAIILTLVSAFMQKANHNVFILLLIAAFFLIISGLITRFGNQPINKIVLSFSKSDVPENWVELRDKWWSLHILRALTSIIAFCLIVWVSVRKN